MNRLVQEADPTVATQTSQAPDTIDTLDIVLVLVSRRRFIGIATLAGLLLGVTLCIVLKPSFTGIAVIMPPQQQSSAAALMGQLGTLAALGGGGSSSLGLKSPADMYVGILESRTIADEIINRFHLKALYNQKKMQDARNVLKGHTQIETGKDGLIHISVTDRDPNRASALANAYVEDLYGMNSNLAIGEAAQRRVFFDQQLAGEKKALAEAEEDLRATQQKTGLIQLSGQAEMIITSIAQLRAKIASEQVELQSERTFATEQNPDVTRMQEEISTMQAQLAKLENDQRQVQPGNIALPAGSVPEDSLEYARKLREVKYHETLVDLLSRQYEAARIDEAKSAPIIQVIDHAIPPDEKSGPHRSLILLGSVFAGFSLSALWVLFKYSFTRMRRTPETAAKLDEIRSQFQRQ
jgi:tyrosine-protein kinase Etk/Wzc